MANTTIYDVNTLRTYVGEMNADTFDLIGYTHAYEKYISNRDYIYTCQNSEISEFCVQIKNENLPHLLALSKSHHSNLPEYQAFKVFEHLKDDWDLNFLESSDPGYFEEFKLRIFGTFFIYQMLNLINCEVRIPLPKAQRMRKLNIDFIFIPNNSDAILYTLELKTDGQQKDGRPVYFPISLRVKDNKVYNETRKIAVNLVEVIKVPKVKVKKKKKKKPKNK